MTALDLWFEQTLNVGVEPFTAEVANQGPGRLFWRAVWAEPYVSVPQPTPEGVFWTVTGRILLTGTGEATRPTTGELSAEIEVALLGSATLVLPDTPLATEITVALEVITALRTEITVALLGSTTPLSAEITVALLGSGALSAGSSGTSYTLTVEEVDGSPSQVDPTKIVFPNGSLTVDSDGEVIVSLTGLTIEEEDAGPSTAPSKLIFPDTTLSVDSDGNVHYTPDAYSLTVEEVDGNPSLVDPVKLIFPNGTLTTDTDGNVTYTPGGALQYFIESADTASPNNSVNDSRLLVVAGTTDGDFIITPKGAGATVAQRADGTTTGGNKRGQAAIDWQRSRTNAANVASGDRSTILNGTNNKATGSNAIAGGSENAVTAGNAVALGSNNTVSTAAVAFGNANNVSGLNGAALGNAMTVSSSYGGCFGGDGNSATTGSYNATLGGTQAVASGTGAVVLGGHASTSNGVYSLVQGRGAHAKGLQGTFARASENVWGSGTTQWMHQLVSHRTTDATQTVLNAEGTGSADAADSLVLDNNSARGGTIRLLGFKTSGTVAALWEWRDVLATRGANAAATAFIGTPTLTTLQIHATATSETWAPVLAINTTLGSIEVKVTGGSSSSVRWIADFDGLMLV
jgi:hypothetical protein